MALTVFFYAANVIDPGQSSAVTGAPAKVADTHGPKTGPESIGSLGNLTSLEYTVEIHATVDGPRYTVRDANGVILGALLEATEVEQIAPGLELEGMLSEPLMLVEPESSFEQ